MIENPEDYDLASAPVGAGEPHTPPAAAEPLLGHDGKAWPDTFDGLVWAKEFNRRFPAVSVDDALGWMTNAIMRGYDQARWRLGLDSAPEMAGLVVRAMAIDADLHELTGLPRRLGDDRLSEVELSYIGHEYEALRFKLTVHANGMELSDALELHASVIPATPEFLAGAVPALRSHLLRRAGLEKGEPEHIELDVNGKPLEVHP